MNYAELSRYMSSQMNISPRDMYQSGPQITNCGGIQVSFASPKASKTLGLGGALNVVKDSGGSGVWVPYLGNKNFYSHIGASSWAASGPFSGCYFEVGKMGGKVYAAHVSNEGAGSPNLPVWDALEREVWFKARIGVSTALPAGAVGAAAVVFATGFSDAGSVKVCRVDASTPNAGSMTGPIFSVAQVENEV